MDSMASTCSEISYEPGGGSPTRVDPGAHWPDERLPAERDLPTLGRQSQRGAQALRTLAARGLVKVKPVVALCMLPHRP